MSHDKLVFNGINATRGGYLIPPTDQDTLYRVALGETLEAEALAELKIKIDKEAHFGVIAGVDPKKLDEAGWGVIFPRVASDTEAFRTQAAIREALAPLLTWRQAQATRKHAHYYKDYVGELGYQPGESKTKFLLRHGAGPGPADPDKVPYYLLIVGSPEEIPFGFQSQLDIQYAVGRIHFDTVEDYAHYAASVVAAEKQGLSLAKRVAFWGVANQDDRATQTSAQHLTEPLADWLSARQEPHGWEVARFMRDAASKSVLSELLGGESRSALLFTASHGVGFERSDELQLRHQGALLCGDWPGPRAWQKPVGADMYFSGDDLSADAKLHGLLAFFFACYGGGSPRYDEFSKRAFRKNRTEIAPHPFVAGLPKRMLSHPKGGALAVAAHVDRAWGTSYLWAETKDDPGSSAQRAVFESTLRCLMEGHPIGSAFDFFNERYAELSSDLALKIEDIEFGANYPGKERDLARMWTANNDARGYTIIGDPAVRLSVGHPDEGLTPAPEASSSVQISSSPPPSTIAPGQEDVSFGRLAGASDTAAVGDPLQQLREQIGSLIGEALADAKTLQVRTYTGQDMAAMHDGSKHDALDSAVKLQALTRIHLSGDVEVVVPQEGADPALVELHHAMVSQGRQHRTEMMKIAIMWLQDIDK